MSIPDFSQINPQLTLAIKLSEEANLNDFCWSGNEILQQQIKLLLSSFQEKQAQIMYLWGLSGCGKTYLLQAICQEVSKQGCTAVYLPLKLLRDWDPAILEGMSDYHLVVVDDLEQIAGHPEWEEALFHLYNRLYAQHHSLLFTSCVSPTLLPIQLADLRSRVMCALIFQIHELNDDDKISTLQRHAKKCGLELPNNVGHYILNHYARNMQDLQNILQCLDHASLVTQRKLTIPLVKEVLSFNSETFDC